MKVLAFVASAFLFASPLFADAKIGEAAPSFEVKDANGKDQKLADYKGKWVVLEWFNKDCPFVKKHYGSQNMQKLQKDFTAKNVVWLTVNSSAKGKQGYADASQALKDASERGAAPTAILLDADGKVGKAYGAKTTPHMFIINPEQKVVYAGAIDDNDSSDPKVIEKSKNYVSAALTEGLAGKPITTASSRAYGCGVKYN
ncbi:MAG: thioredoxin family protein [Proteobacteria bacterium]|nr:MAG: thioredoxin family protein [Pseudomonadota bacterium]